MSRKSVYIDIDESSKSVNGLQVGIMLLVGAWAKKNPRNPIPRQEVFEKMKKKGKSEMQIRHALETLIRLGYLRKAFTMSNKISYVQLRSVSEGVSSYG